MSRIIVYADFNCPFCYAQSERIDGHAQTGVDWRMVQHMPAIPIPRSAVDDEDDAHSLAEELSRLARLAPDIALGDVHIRPSSHPATLAYAAALEIDPQRAPRLRRELYRALWRDAWDISDDRVLTQITRKVGFGSLLRDLRARSAALLRSTGWQMEWERGPHERRIPVIQRPELQPRLGLVPRDELLTELELALDPDEGDGATCRGVGRRGALR